MKNVVVAAVLGAALLVPALEARSAPAAPRAPAPSVEKARPGLDLGRWLDQRLRRLGRPVAEPDRDRSPRGPRYDPPPPDPCDPSRSHCPIG